MDTDAPSLLAFLVPGVVVPAVLLVLAFRSPTTRQVERWASVCGVVITATNEDLVRSHLGRVRRYRSVAAFPFWWVAAIPIIIGTRVPVLLSPPVAWLGLIAYLTGALVAEVTVPVEHGGPVRRASFSRRSIRDYRPAWLGNLPWVMLAIAGVLLLVPPGDDPTWTRTGPVTMLLAGTGLTVLAEVAAVRIVRRPQRSGDADVLAADDALRATGISMTSGVGVLAAFTSLSSAVPADAFLSWGAWSWLWLVPSALGQILLVGVLGTIVRQDNWGYRRRHRQAVLGDVA